MKIKATISGLLLGASVSLSAGVAQITPVEIDLEARTAMGSMKNARFSENEFEFIGCGTRTRTLGDGTTFQWGFCQAGNQEDFETNAFCMTEDAALLQQIRSFAAFDFIIFNWDEDGVCQYVGSSTQSFYIPSKKFKE